MGQRHASHGPQCSSHSLCGAPCARRSEHAPTSHSRTWRSDSSSPCSAVDQSDRDSGASIAPSGCGSPTGGLSGARRSISYAPRPSFAGTGRGFRAFWTWKSRRGRVGRPRVGSEIAELVRTMALANPLWGAPRIHGELLMLGFDISQQSVARLMPRRPKPPSQTWRTFLQNHLADLVSVDFFVVPTATFRVLYVLVVLLPSSPPNRALQRDRFPDRRLDRATTRRGVPR